MADVILDWDKPNTGDEPFYYEVDRFMGRGIWSNLIKNLEATTYTDTGRTTGQAQSYRVRALGRGGYGDYASVAHTPNPLAKPGPVTNLSDSVDGTGTTAKITLDWGKPTTGNPDNFVYDVDRLNVASPPGTDPTAIATGITATKYIDTPGLAATYNYRVRARNNQDGDWTTVQVKVSATPTPPGALTALSLTQTGTGATADVVISISAPTTGTTPFIYDIQRRAANAQPNAPWTAVATGQSGRTRTDHNPGVGSWRYRARARNDSPTPGDWTDKTITIAAAVVAPSNPSSVTATLLTTGSVSVSWRQVAATGTDPATGFNVRRGTSTTFSTQTTTTISGTPSATRGVWSLRDASPSAGNYYYWVQATNAGGVSSWVRSNRVTVIAKPSSVRSVDLVLYNATSTTKGVVVSWLPPNSGGTPSRYEIRRGTSSTFSTTNTRRVGDTGNQGSQGRWFTRDPSPAAGTYYYWVRACNDGGCSAYSTEFGPFGTPVAITVPQGTNPPTCSLTVSPTSWTYTGSTAAVLRWSTSGATIVEVRSQGGTVVSNDLNGSRGIRGPNPGSSAISYSYFLEASGPGGSCNDSVTVTIRPAARLGDSPTVEVVDGPEP